MGYMLFISIYAAAAFFFFLSSTNSMLSSGMSLYFSRMNSSSSSLTSPCTTISSPPLGSFVTEEPVANFLPKSLATCVPVSVHSRRPSQQQDYAHLLQVQTKRLQTCYCRDKLSLVSLDSLNRDDAGGELVGLPLLLRLGLCRLLLRVLGGSLLGLDRQRCRSGLDCVCLTSC